MFRAIVLTVSDKGAAGQREDKSGAVVREMLLDAGYDVVAMQILPDDFERLVDVMKKVCDEGRAELLITTGGTGFSRRDQTPEATRAVAERIVPGIAEAMRAYSMTKTDRAVLSRGVAVLRKETLIVNLPGSPKAARENLESVLPALHHGLSVLTGRSEECGAS